LPREEDSDILPAPGRERAHGHGDPWIEIHLDHLAWNLRQLKKRVKVPIMAVIKANAYGHGLVEIAQALETAGAEALMVGKFHEALALREAGVRGPILNFGPLAREDCAEIIERNISQSVYTDDSLYLQEAAARLGKKASVHVDIDTGMARTGVHLARALPLIEKIASLPNVTISGVCTTLTEDPEFDKEQLRLFLELCSAAAARGIPLGVRHAASSAGVFYSPEFYLDMIRPGITLYGYYPNSRTRKENALDLKPVLRLSARVVFIKDLVPGESLSYLRAHKAERAMRVAAVGIGYSDGYPYLFGGKVRALIGKKKFPVLSAVTSNHAMVDLGADREVRIGDEVRLIDPDKGTGLTADALAEQSGVPDYKILIGLNPLLPRLPITS
jgi:alanine racemase